MNPPFQQRRRFCLRGASALIIVLASLAFLVALALAFLTSVGTELKSSKRYADGVTAKILAQSAFNLATDQIIEGTKGGDAGNVLAWASQPGMIRTYDSNGNKARYYKLYSWDRMQGKGNFDPTSSGEKVSATWFSDPAVYTDLNKPIKVAGAFQYPIIDGNGLVSNVKDSTGSITIPGKAYDSDGDGKWDIEGFSLAASTPVEAAPASPNPVPMPVKWLYLLEDGKIVVPDGGSGNTATFSGAEAPTPANPIVGRMAFWTDDETSKININTASDGVYWDTPRVKSRQDDVFKVNQPVNGEYQRYPGHPAMTSLSTVIKYPAGWTPGTSAPTITLGSANAIVFKLSAAEWTDNQWGHKIYGITPRIGAGGSEAGTLRTAMLPTGSTAPGVTLDGDRLYAGVEELAFKPDRTSNNSELANLGVLSQSMLERAKFFLTASSRSPDVNLFNKPRVSIWPIHTTNTAAYRTPFDRLIAFCSTLDGFTYYFERLNPNSPTADLALNRNTRLLNYLRGLAGQKIPGFGGDFASKYPADKDQVITEIFDYIRSTNLRDPLLVNPTNELMSTSYTVGDSSGLWKNYQSPVRGTNGQGQVVPIVDSSTGTRGFGRFVTLTGASVLFIGQVDGDGPLCPMDPDHQPIPPYPAAANTQADPVTGRPLPYWTSSVVGPPAVPGVLKEDKVAPGKMRIQAMFLPRFFSPSVGATWLRRNLKWSVDLTGLKVNGNALGFPSNLAGMAPRIYTANQTPRDETGFGDQAGLNMPVESAGVNIVSTPIDVDKGTMSFSGMATVKIYAPDSTLLQTIVLDFNGPDCSVPALAHDHVANRQQYKSPSATEYPFDDAVYHYFNYRTFLNSTGRYNSADPQYPASLSGGRIRASLLSRSACGFIMIGDAIRSVRQISGDARIIAAQENPPASLFEANPVTADILGAHSFLTGYGNSYYGAGLGKLVKDLAYSGSGITTANLNTTADGEAGQSIFFNNGFAYGSDGPLNGVEVGSSSAISGNGIPGDWDNSPFAVRDGPFINKADEGDVGGVVNGTLMEPYFWKLKAQAGGGMNTNLFSPNRMIPSAVTFGSLSTGVKENRPWQTLLFRPMPGHPGSGTPVNTPVGPPYTTPPDHLLLEMFSMPVVEPYAISEPMSTAGRINMNYQIVPFTYINRETGIRALLKAEKVISIVDSQASVYKDYRYSTTVQRDVRLNVNPEETLKGFDLRFNPAKYGLSSPPDIFRSASEICDLHIVPVDASSADDTYDTMAAYWANHQLTGDNSKERIYATLYPRLTTKSNTFTIHVKVQTLKKLTGSAADTWTEGKDQVTGEYRGSQTIERFIDPNDKRIPDYTISGTGTPISSFYKIRVVGSKQFAP